MMAQKQLCKLLEEDQEPFLLKDYIAGRKFLLKRPSPKSQLQARKRKPPLSQASKLSQNFCKSACIFSFTNSPDPRKSPLFEFQSPAKSSPCKNPNAIFLHIPAKTAALLLEAALRIQKQSSSKAQNRNSGYGLFGSILKRLKNRSKTPKREISGDGVKLSVKDILRWDPPVGRRKFPIEKDGNKRVNGNQTSSHEASMSCPCKARPSSAIWSESNEEKSLDLELDTSSNNSQFDDSDDDEDFVAKSDNPFCESPFRFVLQRSPSPGRRTPDFSSPAISPGRHSAEGKEADDVEGSKKLLVPEVREEVEEEDKEQCSPVSVLEPTFEDDDNGHDDQSEDDGFDLECSYAIVQRAKQQLLRKLRRFERLAELDPVELEKRMLEQEEEVDDEENNSIEDPDEDMECKDDEFVSSNREKDISRIIVEQLGNSTFCSVKKIPRDLKRLVSDIVDEEKRDQFAEGEAGMVKRVCKRFQSWKEVDSDTIDMMVEQDFNELDDGSKRNKQEHVGETAQEIEFFMCGQLLEELTEDLLCLIGIQ